LRSRVGGLPGRADGCNGRGRGFWIRVHLAELEDLLGCVHRHTHLPIRRSRWLSVREARREGKRERGRAGGRAGMQEARRREGRQVGTEGGREDLLGIATARGTSKHLGEAPRLEWRCSYLIGHWQTQYLYLIRRHP